MKKTNSLQRNNLGFTLVELVIVIAILAIMVGIMAPFFTRYVEKSRRQSDVSNVSNMRDILNIAFNTGEIAFGDADGSSAIWIYVTPNQANFGTAGNPAIVGAASGVSSDDAFEQFMSEQGFTTRNLALNAKAPLSTGSQSTDEGWAWYCIYILSDGTYGCASDTTEQNDSYISSIGNLKSNAVNMTDRDECPMVRALRNDK